ncbi:hypothetical protein FH603_1225 [Spirosoma sp. LMG 31447]|uniref:Uncharacterized protein n=1 Tax=Spirosoma utsteinense TaxID=2585773 RepID=A0ABR6W2C4_9BACT|nr:hypothetical protein [Spirosoma utsteinense]
MIGRELDNALELFDIYGVLPNQNFEPFCSDNQYIAFLVTSKR